MIQFLAKVLHEVPTNTLEVTIMENTGVELRTVLCRNFSAAERAEFEALLGVDAAKYVLMAGW